MLDRTTLSRTETVVEALGRRIVGGEFHPGGALPIEPELVAMFDASRNVVREAVKTLVGKGFLKTERRLGTVVQPRDRWAMLDPQVLSWMLGNPDMRGDLLKDLSDLRRIIEPEAAALAARNASITDRLRLLEAFAKMNEQCHQRDLAIVADVAFHERLFEAAHNSLLTTLARSVDVLLQANFEIAMETDNGFIRNLAQHGAVAEAINDRDEPRARAAMQTLLINNDEDLRKIMSTR